MIKKSILIVSIITSLHMHAMENNEPMEVEESTPFYIALLPIDMQNRIAHFLTFDDIESAEEFITRTQATLKKAVPEKYYYKDFQIPSDDLFPDSNTITSFHGTSSFLTGFCPNEINIALLCSKKLRIVNVNKDQELHTENLEEKAYQHIALSRGAHMFATIHEQREIDNTPRRTEVMRYIVTHYLTIKNIASQKTEQLGFPGSFRAGEENSSTVFAFNKQGTHIILRGVDYTQTENLTANDMEKNPHHRIIPVTINRPHPEPKKKTLQHYFEHKLICKKLPTINDK